MNLKELEKKLNEDEKLRNSFFENPVGVFKKEGITLPEKAEGSLKKLVEESRKSKKDVPGSSLHKGGRGQDVTIEIVISKDF